MLAFLFTMIFKNLDFYFLEFCLRNNLKKQNKNILRKDFLECKTFVTFFENGSVNVTVCVCWVS